MIWGSTIRFFGLLIYSRVFIPIEGSLTLTGEIVLEWISCMPCSDSRLGSSAKLKPLVLWRLRSLAFVPFASVLLTYFLLQFYLLKCVSGRWANFCLYVRLMLSSFCSILSFGYKLIIRRWLCLTEFSCLSTGTSSS